MVLHENLLALCDLNGIRQDTAAYAWIEGWNHLACRGAVEC